MRKISFEASNALRNRENYKSGNTIVDRLHDGTSRLLLHRNEIARIDSDGSLWVTDAGWNTATTKERLNSLINVHIQQKAGVWYLNSREWSGAWVKINNDGSWSY